MMEGIMTRIENWISDNLRLVFLTVALILTIDISYLLGV